MTLKEFYALPTLSSFFPLRFKHGGRWLKMDAKCAACELLIEDRNVRGHVRQLFGETFMIDGHGYCQQCRKLTRVELRLLKDMSMVAQNLKTGEWMQRQVRTTWTWRAWLRKQQRQIDRVARLLMG